MLRLERVQEWTAGAPLPIRDRGARVDQWRSVPVSEWIARRFGDRSVCACGLWVYA